MPDLSEIRAAIAEEQKCCVINCQERGLPVNPFDFYVCERHNLELYNRLKAGGLTDEQIDRMCDSLPDPITPTEGGR